MKKSVMKKLADAARPFTSDQACDAVHHPIKDRHDQRDECPIVMRLRKALAAYDAAMKEERTDA